MPKMNTSNFKVRCLAILDWIHKTVERVAILMRGRTVAEPSTVVDADAQRYPQKELKGTVVIAGDVVDPVLPKENWDSLK